MTSFYEFFKWDAFISHASEDKDDFVRPLADGLKKRGLSVWFDEFELKVGDSLRESIDRGLERSRFGIVVISPHFFKKQWPQNELNGLTTRETGGTKVIQRWTLKFGQLAKVESRPRKRSLECHGRDGVIPLS